MMPDKLVSFDLKKILLGIDIAVDAVKITLGPRGRNVIIGGKNVRPVITNDGVSVLRSLKHPDPSINLGFQLVLEVCSKTERGALDGTTTTAILYQAIIKEGIKRITPDSNVMDIRKGIELTVERICNELKEIKAVQIDTFEEIFNVANISVENPEIAETIAKVLNDVGTNGVVVVEESEVPGIVVEKASGYTIDKGFADPYIINNYAKLQGEYDNVSVLITDRNIAFSEKLIPLLEKLAQSGQKRLLIVANEIEGEALSTFKLNRARNILDIIPVRFNTLGDDKKEELQDIALRCNTVVIDDNSGLKFEDLQPEMLGRVSKVIIKKDSTTLVNGEGNVEQRIADLEEIKKTSLQPEYIASRIAKLQGNTAVLRVGAVTDTERQYLKMKLDDAVGATKGAMEEGIVDGGGYALANVYIDTSEMYDDVYVGSKIIEEACKYPYMQLLENSGVNLQKNWLGKYKDKEVRYHLERLNGYNAKTGKFTWDLMEEGVVDPVKVTVNALKNAASSASLFLTASVSIVDLPDKEQTNNYV